MPPMSSRMTKQPERLGRFFPGKALAEDHESQESDSESGSEEEEQIAREQSKPVRKPPPTQRSSGTTLSAAIKASAQKPTDEDDLEGFVTASESSEGEARADGASSDEEEEEDESSSEEEDSSDDEPKRPMLAPKFIPKAKRAQQQSDTTVIAKQQEHETERLRTEKTNALLQAQLERDAAVRAANRKAWDGDNDVLAEDQVNDTDDLDPEAERAAWKLRELKRVKRDREALIEKEKEREEIERRRNMSAEDREREDREFLSRQQDERDGKGKMAFMQKYYHKGAFFQGGDEGEEEEQDEEVKRALSRDLAGVRFEDETGDKSVLPEYMRIRDMTRLGKKGRSKYRDLKEEDTGKWGLEGGKRRDFDGLDERFRPDERGREGGGRDRTGANAAPVGERRRRDEDGGGERDVKRVRHG